jgi:hypothetical protein
MHFFSNENANMNLAILLSQERNNSFCRESFTRTALLGASVKLGLYDPYIKCLFYRGMVGCLDAHGDDLAGFKGIDNAINPKPCGSIIRCCLGVVAVGYFL